MAVSDKKTGVPHTMRIVFGIFMVCIYIGMGVLMLIDFFHWTWAWARYGLAALFIIYGIWRAYRQFTFKE